MTRHPPLLSCLPYPDPPGLGPVCVGHSPFLVVGEILPSAILCSGVWWAGAPACPSEPPPPDTHGREETLLLQEAEPQLPASAGGVCSHQARGAGDGQRGQQSRGSESPVMAWETDGRVLSPGSGPGVTRTWRVEESGRRCRESSRPHSGARERCGARDTSLGGREVSSGGREPVSRTRYAQTSKHRQVDS